MRRAVIALCVFLLIGVALALLFRNQQGLVLVSFNGWRIQTSLAFACAAILVIACVMLALIRLALGAFLLPGRVQARLARRRGRVKQKAFAETLKRVAEQRWSAAEKQVRRVVRGETRPGLSGLIAAGVVGCQGRVDERDQYLGSVASGNELSPLAVDLTRAELQTRAGQVDDSLVTLARLYERDSRHPRVVTLYARQLDRAGDYETLRTILPRLAKYGNLDDRKRDAMARRAWKHALEESTTHAETLISTWSRMPDLLQNDGDMIVFYIECLRRVHAEDEARQIVVNYLAHSWNGELAKRYGQLSGNDSEAQLAIVEKWIDKHGRQPELLLVAGRLCLRCRYWGRARGYLESSHSTAPRADVLLELGSLYEQVGEPDNARDAYRQGLALEVHA